MVLDNALSKMFKARIRTFSLGDDLIDVIVFTESEKKLDEVVNYLKSAGYRIRKACFLKEKEITCRTIEGAIE